MVYLKLKDYPVLSIICSTNDDRGKKNFSSNDIECDTNLRSNKFSNYEIYTNLRLICPRSCSSDKSPIYGTGIYTDNSSICKAALHSGIIKDSDGGVIQVIIESGKKDYIGSTRFSIESLDYSKEWDRSFRIIKYNPYCPVDKLKEFMKGKIKESSFISVEEKFANTQLSQINYNELNTISEFPYNKENRKSIVITKELEKLINYYRFSNKISLKKDTPSNKNNKFNINATPYYEMTTEDAITSIYAIKEKFTKQIEINKSVGQDFKTLIGKIIFQINILNLDKELGLKNQESVHNTLKKRTEIIMKKIFNLSRKFKQRVFKTEHLLNKARVKIDNFLKMDQFIEDYSSQNIFDNYSVFNNMKGIGNPSKWDYYMYNLNGHFKTIIQKHSFFDSRSVFFNFKLGFTSCNKKQEFL